MEPPEAKKSRLDSTISRHQASKKKLEARKILFQRYKNGEADKVIEEIKAQKTFLRSKKTNVKEFFEEDIEKFWQYETFFTMLASEMLAEPSKCNEKSFEALHEVIKLLTAACVSSSISAKSTPTELFSNRNKNISVPKLFTQILESGGEKTKTRVLLFDYISGLCTRKEGLCALSSFSAFIDQIAISIASPNKEIRDAALSTVIFVSNKKYFLKAFLNSNGGYYIGALLSQWNFDEIKTKETKLLVLFENFSTFDKRSFGRQIATSPGTQALKELLFISSDETTSTVIHKWHRLIMDLLMASHEFRETYGKEMIDRIIQEYDSSDTKLKLLTLFARDPYARIYLRETGKLRLILEGCSDTFDTRTFFIAKRLGSFMLDQESLIAIARNDAFLDKILFLLQKYCNETKDKDCPPPENKITLRPDSPNFLQHLEEKRQNMNITNFYVDFADLESSFPSPQQGSLSPRIRSAWSPSASRTSASPSPSSSPSRSPFSDDDSDAWITHPPKKEDEELYSDSEYDEEMKETCRDKRREKIVIHLLNLLDWFTHYPGNHLQLLRKPVFETLISLSSTELPISEISKACRSIKRLIRSEESLPHLLGLKLHLHIISLIRRPCLMHRYADRCLRCEDRRKFGREVIQELSLQANSASGWNFMQELLRSDDPDTQLYACSTALTLIRDVKYRSRLFYYYDVLTKLLDSFKSILQNAANEGNKLINLDNKEEGSNSTLENVHQARVASLKEDILKLEAILFSFASLLSHKMQSAILETQTEPFPLDATEEICLLENAEIPPAKQIRFRNSSGDLLVTAHRDSLCRYSAYYEGMFGMFAEKFGEEQEFVVGNEGMYIKDEQFIKFIHLLSGCKKSHCVAVDETSTCISLIYLADKYLATELLETMFLPNGIAGRFITGSTLSSFAPIILTALSTHGRFSDLFFFVFLRYASISEICDTLAASLSFSSGETFLDLFKEFLQRCVSSLPNHQSYRLWI